MKTKTGVFTLGGPLEGKTMVILDKYSFVEGKMHVSAIDAALMKRILCEHYGCTLTHIDAETGEETDSPELSSLAVGVTRGATEGAKMTAQATNVALATVAQTAPSDGPTS